MIDSPEEAQAWGREKVGNKGEKAEKLLYVGFIREARYTTWLPDVVMVNKANGKWRMCVDYMYLCGQ